jgi:hypothetical protein
MANIITVNGCRVLTPHEYRIIRENLNVNHKTVFDALLFTGMRNTEFEQFVKNPDWFQRDRKLIRLTPTAIKKVKIKFKDRSVFLSTLGLAAIERLLDYKPLVPHRASWNTSLKRAAKKANIDPTGIEPKMTRKTWESWLVASYPEATLHVLSSQGHDTTTALGHYVSIGFTSVEISEIKHYTEGWLLR